MVRLSAEGLLSIIDEHLDFSTIEAGKLPLTAGVQRAAHCGDVNRMLRYQPWRRAWLSVSLLPERP